LRGWGAGLKPDADILIFGCNVGAGSEGAGFVQQLAQLTGADIAASNDRTGQGERGDNMLLEVRDGAIEADVGGLGLALSPYLDELLDSRQLMQASTGLQLAESAQQTWQEALARANQTLTSFANQANFSEILQEAFGTAGTDTTLFDQRLAALQLQLAGDGMGLTVELRSNGELNGAAGAYAAVGHTGTERIYLNADWITNGASAFLIRQVLLEEAGHAIDKRLNGTLDSEGDEGELFAKRLTGEELTTDERAATQAEDDSAALSIDGVQVLVEKAIQNIVDFTGAFQTQNWTEAIGVGGYINYLTNNQNGVVYSIVLGSADDGGGGRTYTDLSIVSPFKGSLSFAWAYTTADRDGPSYDPFGYIINGSYTELTTPDLKSQSGSLEISLNSGDRFTLREWSTDSILGRGIATITNFNFSYLANSAPTIFSGNTYNLTTTNENTTSSATAVSTILTGTSLSDEDTNDLSGLAITASTGNGTWRYSTDGTTWQAFGPVSSTNALLLTSTTQIRYSPDGNNGESATFNYKAWDQTSGSPSTNTTANYATTTSSGGTSAFSTNTSSAQIIVSSINDAPALDSTPSPVLSAINEDTQAPSSLSTTNSTLISALVSGISDVDSGALKGIAITAVNSANGTL